MSPIPSAYSFWWINTNDEPQWTDEQLDGHAVVLSKPTDGGLRPWLTEEERLRLEGSTKLAIAFEDETGKEVEVVFVSKRLIVGLSRDLKDMLWYNLQDCGCDTTRISDWFHYLVLAFGRPCLQDDGGRLLKKEGYEVGVEVYERREELWRASKVFFAWMMTGKVVVEKTGDGIEVGKELLLALARALGAPLFRKAILRDCET